MSDILRCLPLQLGILGFSDDPGEHGLVVDASTAIHKRWFALSVSQIRPAASVSGSASGPDLHSNVDIDHDRQPNIRFVTVVLRVGSRTVYHNEKLDACISAKDADQLGIKVAPSLFDTLADRPNNALEHSETLAVSYLILAVIILIILYMAWRLILRLLILSKASLFG